MLTSGRQAHSTAAIKALHTQTHRPTGRQCSPAPCPTVYGNAGTTRAAEGCSWTQGPSQRPSSTPQTRRRCVAVMHCAESCDGVHGFWLRRWLPARASTLVTIHELGHAVLELQHFSGVTAALPCSEMSGRTCRGGISLTSDVHCYCGKAHRVSLQLLLMASRPFLLQVVLGKPDPLIFQLASQRLGLQPHEVGATQWDWLSGSSARVREGCSKGVPSRAPRRLLRRAGRVFQHSLIKGPSWGSFGAQSLPGTARHQARTQDPHRDPHKIEKYKGYYMGSCYHTGCHGGR